MSLTRIQQKAINNREARPFQQFGQSGDAYTANGATGCTHTVLQWFAWFLKGAWYTHDQISKMVGYPNQSLVAVNRRRGLYPSEVSTFLKKAGLPYTVKFGLTATQVINIANKLGPVGFGHQYSWVPEWRGFRYGGIVADGKPNGFAYPYGKAGKTQLVGFTGAHFGIYFGYDTAMSNGTTRAYAWETNHGSPARPERPPYDRMTTTQFRSMYDSYKNGLGRTPYAVVPTRAL